MRYSGILKPYMYVMLREAQWNKGFRGALWINLFKTKIAFESAIHFLNTFVEVSIIHYYIDVIQI